MPIEILDQSVEIFSCSRVVIAPHLKTLEEIPKTVKPLTDDELYKEYPAEEEVNNNDPTEAKENPSTDTNETNVKIPKDSTHDANEKKVN